MPALIHFQRKWLIACDDLVIPFAIEAFLRIIWLLGTFVMAGLEISGSDVSLFMRFFLYAAIIDLLFTICLCLGISVISSKGSVLEAQKRIHLAKVLYVKCATVIFEIVLACYAVWLLFEECSLPLQWKIFTEGITVCLWLYLVTVIIGYLISYNSLGSLVHWNKPDSSNSLQIFKRAERIWHLRLKFFCCCADVSDDDKDFIYIEISTFLATFSNDIDLTPTDILAGLITVSKKHAIEKRKSMYQKISKSDILLENFSRRQWMTAENAIYFLRIAKSTYGWLAFFDTLRPWKLCLLLSPKCCINCFCPNNNKHGDCCFCNSSALEKISGLPNSDVLYSSFSNYINEPAFVIMMDHAKKCIIIAIRGTRSFSDLITVINLEEMDFPMKTSSHKLKCHGGALRSALFIYKKIHELNILKVAFVENSSYTLVLTGHSLGGSIAAVLGLLLRPEYPSLQCYAYGPLAVISADGVSETIDFVFTVIVGDDVVPRISVHSSKELMVQLYKSLEETQLPKYKILTKAFWNYVRKSASVSHEASSTSQIYENKEIKIEDESPIEHVQINIPQETQLYAPGRILHLTRGERCDYSWVTGFDFHNIIISSQMIKDHQPHEIQFLLGWYKSYTESSAAIQSSHKVSDEVEQEC